MEAPYFWEQVNEALFDFNFVCLTIYSTLCHSSSVITLQNFEIDEEKRENMPELLHCAKISVFYTRY